MSKRLLAIVSASALLFPARASAQEFLARIDAPIVVANSSVRFQKLGNINGDGFTDAFSAWWASNSYTSAYVGAHINDQQGRFLFSWLRSVPIQPTGTSFWAVASGDVDADGLDDFVLGAGSRLSLLRTAPGGSLPPGADAWFPQGGPAIHGVALLDTDGDPEREIAVVHGNVTILDGISGPPGVLTEIASLPLGAVDGEVLAADLDADGHRDLLVWDATRVFLILVQSGIPQPPYATFLHGCADPRAQVGDLDGDGDEDVVVFDTQTYRVLRRTGVQSWTPEDMQVGGPARYLYDLDGDGDLDGTCCGGGGGSSSVDNTVASFFRIALNDGSGHFAPAISFPGLGSERLAGAADLDHDGDLDLVAGRCIYYMPGRIEDGAPRVVPIGIPQPDALVDADGDGDPDLRPGPALQRNQGDGTFAPFTPVLPVPPQDCGYQGSGYPGDFDGDGDGDLVVGMLTNGAFANMQLLLNAGGGSYEDGGPAGAPGIAFGFDPAGPSAAESIATDADGDGDLDLVVRGAVSPQWASRIFWNDGAGHFGQGPSWPFFRIHRVADLNADGWPDLVGYNSYAGGTYGTLAVFAGTGSQGFSSSPAVSFQLSTANTPWTSVIDVGDADGDGDLDVGAGSVGTALYLNTGSVVLSFVMTELAHDSLSSSDTAAGRGFRFADVDGDGRLDVIAWPAPMATNAARVFLRRSDNAGYTNPVLQMVRPTAVLDVDGDGDLDLLAANLHKNRTFEGLDGGLRRQGGGAVAGAGGVVPTLGAVGPFRGIGSPIEMRLSGATGGVHGLWHFKYLAEEPPPASGLPSAVVQRYFPPVPMKTSGTPGAVGAGKWTLTFPVPSIAIGRTKRYWVTLQDTWSPTGTARSNDLFVTYGP